MLSLKLDSQTEDAIKNQSFVHKFLQYFNNRIGGKGFLFLIYNTLFIKNLRGNRQKDANKWVIFMVELYLLTLNGVNDLGPTRI